MVVSASITVQDFAQLLAVSKKTIFHSENYPNTTADPLKGMNISVNLEVS